MVSPVYQICFFFMLSIHRCLLFCCIFLYILVYFAFYPKISFINYLTLPIIRYPLWGDSAQVASAAKSLASLIGDNAKKQLSPRLSPQLSLPVLVSPRNKSSSSSSSSSSNHLSQSGGNLNSLSASASAFLPLITSAVIGNLSSNPSALTSASASASAVTVSVTASTTEGSSYLEVWRILTKADHASGPDTTVITQRLSDLGLCECSQLEYLTEQEIKDLSAMLKPIPRREFESKLAKALSKKI